MASYKVYMAKKYIMKGIYWGHLGAPFHRGHSFFKPRYPRLRYASTYSQNACFEKKTRVSQEKDKMYLITALGKFFSFLLLLLKISTNENFIDHCTSLYFTQD